MFVSLLLALISSASAWQQLSSYHRTSTRRVSRLEFPQTAASTTEASTTAPETSTSTSPGDWESFKWREQWYPLAFTKTLDKKMPTRVELLGDPIVLWFDHVEERWGAMVDSCPHRLAPLSEGRVDENGEIECPYHGWTFESSGGGACTKVPQAVDPGDKKMLARVSGTPIALVEKQGLLWGWGQPGALASLLDESKVPTCEALDDQDFCWIDVSRDMPYSADMLLENVLDSSHVPFTHHQTISKRENVAPLPLVLTDKITPGGFAGRFDRDESKVDAAKGTDSSGYQGRLTERSSVFRAPTYMHHRIQTAGKDGSLDSGFETWTVAYATPTGPGRCRLFARFPFRFPAPKFGPNLPRLVLSNLPDWVNHMGQLKVLDDDNIFLPLQERRVAAEGGWKGKYVMPTAADAYVTAYRRWFDSVEPVPYAAGAVDVHTSLLQGGQVDKAALLDRKAQHTDHCVSCSGALKNAKRIQKASKYLLLGALALSPSVALPCFAAAKAQAAAAAAAAAASATTAVAAGPSSSALFAPFFAWSFAVAKASLVELKPLLALALACAGVAKAWSAASFVECTLTSGMWTYPPPRNQPTNAKGNSKNLKTVDQGRNY